MEFEWMMKELTAAEKKTVAVAAAEDEYVLETVCQAYENGIAAPILFGRRSEIESISDRCGLDISRFEIIDVRDEKRAAQEAVSAVKRGEADMLMKGLIKTADLLREVLDRENGLRSGTILSHVGILSSPVLERIFLVTDAAIIPYPGLAVKAEMIRNAVAAANGMGIRFPKVAPLAAVEVVNPDMAATTDAASLTVMNRRGQITGCIVDGPLALDLAISPEAAAHKKVDSEVAGKADILLFHNIEAANSTLKAFTHAGNCLFGGVVMGASAPVILTSRSDSAQSKLFSIACAALISGRRRKEKDGFQ